MKTKEQLVREIQRLKSDYKKLSIEYSAIKAKLKKIIDKMESQNEV